MNKFKVYSHDRSNYENEMVYICTCDSKTDAQFVVNALKYKDTQGGKSKTKPYDYYIKETEPANN